MKLKLDFSLRSGSEATLLARVRFTIRSQMMAAATMRVMMGLAVGGYRLCLMFPCDRPARCRVIKRRND